MIERINLVPKKPHSERAWVITYWVMASFFLLIAIAIYFEHYSLNSQLAGIDNLYKGAQKKEEANDFLQARVIRLKSDVAQKEKQLLLLQEEVNKIEDVGDTKQLYSKVLWEIGRALSKTMVCTNLEIDGRKGVILGQAINYYEVPLFVERLKNGLSIKKISLQDITKTDDANHFAPYAFHLIFEVN